MDIREKTVRALLNVYEHVCVEIARLDEKKGGYSKRDKRLRQLLKDTKRRVQRLLVEAPPSEARTTKDLEAILRLAIAYFGERYSRGTR